MKQENELKNVEEMIKNKVDLLLRDAESLEFKLGKDIEITVEQVESKDPIPARVKLTLKAGTIEIKGNEEFVSKYTNQIYEIAMHQLIQENLV